MRTTDATLPAPERQRSEHARAPAVVPGALVLDRYRLERLLGHGGFATVWQATDVHLGRKVAVKRIPRSALGSGARTGRVAERAMREARTAARLAHPAVVALFEAGSDEQACYLVSELILGPTLAELELQGGLSDRDLMEIGLSLCEALEHAHARGIVHRDVKPANVIVPGQLGAQGQYAKLTDFGVARVVGEPALTRTGDVVGTLAYMAPEQALGRSVGPASDVYSLGLILYEGLAGRHPVGVSDPVEAVRRVGRALPSLQRVRPDLPADLVGAVDAAVCPDPRARVRLCELAGALARASPQAADQPHCAAAGPQARVGRVGWRPRLPPAMRPAGGAGGRVLGASGAGALCAGALAGLGPSPPLAPALGGAAVGAAALMFPRLAWPGASAALGVWLILEQRPGLAVMVALLVAPTVLLVKAPSLRPVPALAPALGMLGLAGAFPALAGQARRAPTRLLLGVLGAWWLCLAEALLEHQLLLGAAVGAESRSAWESSVGEAFTHAFEPLANSGALALGAVWGAGALLLPWLVRGRAPAWDIVGAGVWALALALGTQELAGALGSSIGGPSTRAMVLGGGAAAALAVAFSAGRPRAVKPVPMAVGASAGRARPAPAGSAAPRPGPARG